MPANTPKRRWMRAGQAVSIGRSLAIIVLFGILWGAIAKEPFNRMNEAAHQQVSNQTAQQGFDYTATIFQHFLFVVVVVCVLGTIAIAVYQRQGGVR